MLGDISGEPCPRCACKDTRVVAVVRFFGRPMQRLRCRHCGHTFSPKLDEAIEDPGGEDIAYQASCRCPKCAARNPAVKSTQKKGTATVRYHRCECGHRFRSVEAGTS